MWNAYNVVIILKKLVPCYLFSLLFTYIWIVDLKNKDMCAKCQVNGWEYNSCKFLSYPWTPWRQDRSCLLSSVPRFLNEKVNEETGLVRKGCRRKVLVRPPKDGCPESEQEGRGYELGLGRALGLGEERKPGCGKGLLVERSGENGWKGGVQKSRSRMPSSGVWFYSIINENDCIEVCWAWEKKGILGGDSCFREIQKRGCLLAGVTVIAGPPISSLIGADFHSGSWEGAQES